MTHRAAKALCNCTPLRREAHAPAVRLHVGDAERAAVPARGAGDCDMPRMADKVFEGGDNEILDHSVIQLGRSAIRL